eukprot:1369196-Amorphochlora_amoeboformis.AAC.1
MPTKSPAVLALDLADVRCKLARASAAIDLTLSSISSINSLTRRHHVYAKRSSTRLSNVNSFSSLLLEGLPLLKPNDGVVVRS